MERTTRVWAVAAAALIGVAGCGEKTGGTGTTAAPPAATTVTADPPAASAVPPASAPPSAAPTESAAPARGPTDAEATAEPTTPSKKYDCGAKTQKPCPMQAWMKNVLAKASASGDAGKLAEALAFAAKKPPPGYTEWAAMANAGVARAKAGDVDGAKASCKRCHDAYKEDYKAKMRDRPW